MTHRVGTGLLILCLAIGVYAMLADFFNLRRAQQAEPPQSLDILAWPQPWGGYAFRNMVITSGADWRQSPDTVAQILDSAASRYPIDAEQWLDRARISVGIEDSRDVDVLLRKALATRPLHRPTLWAAAQIALQTGDAQLAERQLRQWLEHYPNDTGRALFIGKRWISEPAELLDRMLPAAREYLEEAMRMALRQEDLPLAEEVWQRLDPKPELDDPVFLHYVELLLKLGEIDQAVELWLDRDPTWNAGMLVNGNFSRELGPALGLNWRTDRAPAGVRIERDRNRNFTEPASLRIDFNGKENVNLNAPWIRIPVQPGQHYRLSGVWSAKGLTTRARPYLQLTAEGNRSFRETVELPGTRFEWAPWSIEFLVPEETHLMRLFVRRESTQAFDRNIDGTLWLDEFRLEPAANVQTLQSAASEALGRRANNPVSGFGFPVSGENQNGAASGSGGNSVGAGSGQDESAQDAPPTADKPANTPTGESDSAVGAASSRDDRGPETGIAAAAIDAAETALPARKPETGNWKPAPSARSAR